MENSMQAATRMPWEPDPDLKFQVRYYDARLSRKGQGVQVKKFKTLEEAEAFASVNVLYAKPCKVEPA